MSKVTLWPLSGHWTAVLWWCFLQTRDIIESPDTGGHVTALVYQQNQQGVSRPQRLLFALVSKLSVSSGRDFLWIIFSIMCKYMFLFVCGLVPALLPQWAERGGCPGIVCWKINDIFSRRCDLVRSRLKVMHRIYLLFSPTTILNRPQCLTGFCGAGPAISPSPSTISDSDTNIKTLVSRSHHGEIIFQRMVYHIFVP